MLDESTYEIRKIREKHKQPKQVIISQVRNFYENGSPLKPILRIGTSNFTWNRWQHYFYKILVRWEIPFHYFIEQVANEYSVFVANPEYAPSYFLRELIDAKVIPPIYENALVIAVGEDFSLELVDDRFYQQLSFRLTVPIQIRNSKYIDAYAIKYIDEIIDWNAYQDAIDKKLIKFDIVPSTYFSVQKLQQFYRKYRSSIRSI